MRLTSELLSAAPSYLNPLKERELNLRGHKIPAIENLGITKDQDAIDFTDNDIQQLGNFPLFPRLKTLLLARNRISNIQHNLPDTIPNLVCLVLTSNNINELADLEPLSRLTQLVHLTLLENPVTRKEHYRSFIIWKCPSVRFLDYERVLEKERKEAKELFGTLEEPSDVAAKIMGIKPRVFDVNAPTAGQEKNFTGQFTKDEKARIQEMIRNATSLDEVARLEKQLRDGTFMLESAGITKMEE